MILVYLKFLILLPVVMFLHFVDLFNNRGKIHMFGIEGYFGLMGQGKTISMTRRLNRLRDKYGDGIYIMTNYFYEKQDIIFEDWKQLLYPYDKPLVCAWDEVQNEFTSRNFKNFPVSLLTQLTQVRKGNGILLLYSAQRWGRVDKIFRELSTACHQCTTWLGRYTIDREYRYDDYNDLCGKSDVDSKRRIKPVSATSFVQTLEERDSFDSYKMLETAKSKEYMNREEIALINNQE